MLSRFVRTQLIIFAIVSVVGISVLAVRYLQVPTFFGIGHITVTLELPAGGGLYPLANVTYRGVQVGRVTAVTLESDHRVDATLSLDSSVNIPSDLRAEVRSISAVGEQYVDLKPTANRPPYLHDASVIPMSAATIPQPVGPVLDRTSALLDSIPNDSLNDVIGETARGFGGAAFDLGSLLDSGAALGRDLDGVADNSRDLIHDASPLVDSQVSTTDDIRVWAHSLADVTEQLTTNDPQLRKVLQSTPGFARDVGNLLDQLKPTLPLLLANLTSIGQVTLTYNPGLEQLFVLLPPAVAASQSSLPKNNPTGMTLGNFTLELNDPPPCTVGFLPASAWRSPADTATVDTPDGLYCKLPQDSPIAVRGARNIPCMDKPGKRAPTVEICKSDLPFEPLAERQHVLGPPPIDPNLITQGIPPDSRVNSGDHLYGPINGTPPPSGATPTPPQEPSDPAPPETSGFVDPTLAPPSDPSTPSPAVQTSTAPSSFDTERPDGASVSTASYNPRTGSYLGPDRRMYRQTDIAQAGKPSSWTDLMPTS
jgi:phospholipid/cholesterol/gamma-HCH transport system substrate-binding protein